ncbi:MAG: redox-sensing transcriptional repressor Rex [Caldisericaceae bacterium]
MENIDIPFATIERLATYLRCLKHLESRGIETISSKDMAVNTKTTPEQVRKDLSYFGRFGKVGTGYNVARLKRSIERILRNKKSWNMCIVGAGSLGSALARYAGFAESGYNLVAMFDRDPDKIGKKMNGVEIYDVNLLQDVVKEKNVEIMLLTIPNSELQNVEDIIIKSKIKGILNFVPHSLNLKTRRKISVLDVDLAQKLYILSYLMTNKEEH